MKTQAKVKFLIFIATSVFFALLCLTFVQLVKINKIKKQISKQQQEIVLLQEQINSYEKSPDSEHETITGEN